MKILFIINPIAGRSRRPVEDIIRASVGANDHEIRVWSSVDEIDAIMNEIDDDVDVVAAVGGDGTVHEIGKRLVGRPQALAIIPAGSGNGLARHLGVPLDPARAIAGIDACRIESIDVGRINDGVFLGICGVGFDAVVAHRFAEAGTRGLQTYVREGFLTYASYAPEHYVVKLDGESLEVDAFLVAIANSGQYGNDARIAPFASLQDGILDIAIVRTASLLKAPFRLFQLFTGTLKDCADVMIRQARTLELERTSEGPGHVDGEPVILPRTLRCSLAERALRICVPASTVRF